MFTGLTVTLLVLGAPVQVPEVTSGAAVRQFMGGRVSVVGQLERVRIGKGKSEWQGAALVLDDDTTIYVSYAGSPEGWDALVGSRIRVEGLLRPSMSEHEQSLLAPHLRDPGTPKKEPRIASRLIGSRVRVSGIAENAKGGAVLMIDQAPYYLEGLDCWPAEVRGKRLAVGGKLVAKEYLPQSSRDAKGNISQGAAGSQNVIESPTWRLIEEPPK